MGQQPAGDTGNQVEVSGLGRIRCVEKLEEFIPQGREAPKDRDHRSVDVSRCELADAKVKGRNREIAHRE